MWEFFGGLWLGIGLGFVAGAWWAGARRTAQEWKAEKEIAS